MPNKGYNFLNITNCLFLAPFDTPIMENDSNRTKIDGKNAFL